MSDPTPVLGAARQMSPTVVVAAVGPARPSDASTVFRRVDNDEPARIVLRQIDATCFELVEWFRYSGAAGAWVVTRSDLSSTDLASIPPFLSWFASRYGNHTLAALLHDHLVHNGLRLDPPVTRAKADDVFLTALTELDEPYLRSRLMWSAVTLGTLWRSSSRARWALRLWMLLAASGIAALVWGLVTMSLWLVAIAVLAPIPASLLWGWRQRGAALLGGYTLWLVFVPAALNIAVYQAYAVAERVIRRLRLRSKGDKTQVTHPPPYAAR